jgi:hypothetical protein
MGDAIEHNQMILNQTRLLLNCASRPEELWGGALQRFQGSVVFQRNSFFEIEIRMTCYGVSEFHRMRSIKLAYWINVHTNTPN